MSGTRPIFPRSARFGLVVAVLGSLMVTGSDNPPSRSTYCVVDDGALAAAESRFVSPASADEVLAWLDEIDRDGPPATFDAGADVQLAASLPPDLEGMRDIEQRKRAFVGIVLPLGLMMNDVILADRRFVEAAMGCKDSGRPLAPADLSRLGELAAAYKTDGDLEILHRRLDMVPPSLLIAQAAIESGWGTSRFAQEGNALFGQRTTADGMRPLGLEAMTSVRVAAFPHLLASVAAYMHNLNTQPAYAAFRQKRAALRQAGRSPDGVGLASTLVAYSERGQAYVQDVMTIIRSNRFDALDGLRPRPQESESDA